jgi:two-component system, sensor histidine kinase RegB
MVCTLAFSYWRLDMSLPYSELLSVITALTLTNLITLLLLSRQLTPTPGVLFTQLLADVLAVTAVFYLSGGANNPFVSYYLVPLSIAAAALHWRYTWTLLSIALLLYTALFFYSVPLPDIAPHTAHAHHAGHHNNPISFHTLGMWFNFICSALLIAFFISRMALSLKQQNETLAQLREKHLRDEQLLAVATLAAGTAHEMGTPLTTMKVLLKEMQQDCDSEQQAFDQQLLKEDLALLSQQLEHCSATLSQLNQTARKFKDGHLQSQPLKNYCQEIIDNWLLLRPEVRATVHYHDDNPELMAALHPNVAMSINNLLNNAADAEPQGIEVSFRWSADQLNVEIADQGPGIDPQLLAQLGNANVSNKGEGHGLGLFLTHSSIERLGGKLTLSNRSSGGVLAALTIPLP